MSQTNQSSKLVLRKKYKQKRDVLRTEDIENLGGKIFKNYKNLEFKDAKYFHIFLPISRYKEVNTYPILADLFDSNKKVILPKVNQMDMLCCQVKEGFRTELNTYKIPEPIDFKIVDPKLIDVIIMPLLICDKNGDRVGYGGGYYDRFLEECRPDVIKVGVNYFEPLDFAVEGIEPTDIPLDYLVTPKGIVSFIEEK